MAAFTCGAPAGGRIRQVLDGPIVGTIALAFDPRGRLVSGGVNMKVLRRTPGTAEAPTDVAESGKKSMVKDALSVPRADATVPVTAAKDTEEAASMPRKSHWKAWLAVVIAAFFVITLGLSFWLNARCGPNPSLSFSCPSCRKTQKVKAELVGKKIKCPQCAQPHLVPPLDKNQSAGKRRWSLGTALIAAATVAALGACLVLAGLEMADRAQVEEQQFSKETEKVRERETDTFDASKTFPGMKDQDLSRFRGMANLRTLILNDAPITDAGLKEINTLSGLTSLSLTNTEVTDAGLASLKNLTGLEELRLDRLSITDAGLVHLKAFPNLQVLTLCARP